MIALLTIIIMHFNNLVVMTMLHFIHMIILLFIAILFVIKILNLIQRQMLILKITIDTFLDNHRISFYF